MQTTMHHNYILPFVLSCLIGHEVSGQRILPRYAGTTNGSYIAAVAEYGDKVFLGGRFLHIDGNQRTNLQGWNDQGVENAPGAFGNGTYWVWDMEVWAGRLVVAGREPSWGHIAGWDGASWHAMGGGFNDEVRSLVAFEGRLIAAGSEGLIKAWDGMTWSTLGDAVNGVVHSMEVHEGTLYIGGDFSSTAGGVPLPGGLAAWDGSGWTMVAGGLVGSVRVLKSDPLGLLVGGRITSTVDGAMTFPNWAIFSGGVFQSHPEVAGWARVVGFYRMPDGRLFIAGNKNPVDDAEFSLLWDGATTTYVSRFGVRTGRLENGGVVLYGAGGMDLHRFVSLCGYWDEGHPHQEVVMNNIRVVTGPRSNAFYMPMTSTWAQTLEGGFIVPADSGRNTVFSSFPVLLGELGGQTAGFLSMFSQSLSQGPIRQPWAGPMGTTMDDAYYARYHQVWAVTKEEIEQHAAQWWTNGYQMPSSIREWPGNGVVENGEPARLATFSDRNEDGIYDPLDGDHPAIRGDRCIYTVAHADPGANLLHPILPIDHHCFMYSFDAGGDAALANTLFMHHVFVNRGQDTIHNVRYGQGSVFEIGKYYNDQAGCDSSRNLMFAYDVDGMDLIYPNNPPAQGVLFLDPPMGTHRAEFGNHPPLGILDWINATVGGEPLSSVGWPDNYQYPGGAFTAEALGVPPLGHYAVGAAGPFTLAPGDSLCVDLAFIHARSMEGGQYASVDMLRSRADSIQAFYDAQAMRCMGISTQVQEARDASTMRASLFPNPARNMTVVQATGPIASIRILDGLGRLLSVQGPGADRLELDVSHFSVGVYLVQVEVEGAQHMLRLVVTRP